MPRVQIKKKDYMIQDFAGWVAGRMRVKKLRQVDVAKELGISSQALSYRLDINKYKTGQMKDPFSYGDMLILFKLLEATDEDKKRLLTM